VSVWPRDEPVAVKARTRVDVLSRLARLYWSSKRPDREPYVRATESRAVWRRLRRESGRAGTGLGLGWNITGPQQD
jgi:hypothetical protein